MSPVLTMTYFFKKRSYFLSFASVLVSSGLVWLVSRPYFNTSSAKLRLCPASVSARLSCAAEQNRLSAKTKLNKQNIVFASFRRRKISFWSRLWLEDLTRRQPACLG